MVCGNMSEKEKKFVLLECPMCGQETEYEIIVTQGIKRVFSTDIMCEHMDATDLSEVEHCIVDD